MNDTHQARKEYEALKQKIFRRALRSGLILFITAFVYFHIKSNPDALFEAGWYGGWCYGITLVISHYRFAGKSQWKWVHCDDDDCHGSNSSDWHFHPTHPSSYTNSSSSHYTGF